MVNSISIALTGMQSASTRVNVSASNIANAHTAGSLSDENNAPYTPLTTKSKTQDTGGVLTDIIPKSGAPFNIAYDPDSPFADNNGYIGVPDIDIAEEIVNLKLAEITYKASAAIVKVSQENFEELSDLF